jgi:WD40 repeat protein
MLLILLLPAVPAELESAVSLSLADTLEDADIGIRAGKVSPDGVSVLLIGEDGYAHRISSMHPEDRSLDVELSTNRNTDLNDVSWHPRGQTALITGDLGVALRYTIENHAISTVNGSGALLGTDMTAVEWRPAGDYAYFGGSDGSIWKFSEGSGMTALSETRTSPVSDIACHSNQNVCVVTTLNDGMAVISTNDQVTFLSGTSGNTWIGVDCADPTLNECVGFASGLKTQAIRIDTIDPSKSTAREVEQFGTLDGEFTGISRGHDGTTLVYLAPFSTIRHQPLISEAFVQILPEDAAAWDSVISGRSIEFVWENEHQQGFLVTSFGNIVEFETISDEEEMTMISVIVMIAVTVSVPGVVLGLIYMNSPYLQRKYMKLRGYDKK